MIFDKLESAKVLFYTVLYVSLLCTAMGVRIDYSDQIREISRLGSAEWEADSGKLLKGSHSQVVERKEDRRRGDVRGISA